MLSLDSHLPCTKNFFGVSWADEIEVGESAKECPQPVEMT